MKPVVKAPAKSRLTLPEKKHRRLLVPKMLGKNTKADRAIDRVRASVCEGKVISLDVLRRLMKQA